MTQTIMITGASSGIGRAVTLSLGKQRDYHLILVGRTKLKEKKFIDAIKPNSRVDCHECDLSSLREVKVLAEKLISTNSRIDVIINNAGARFDEYRKSEDGIELTFATNHLGHFLLTTQLVEGLDSPPERVINVSSSAHHQAQPELGWNLSKHSFNRKIAYANSKLANILFTEEMARRRQTPRTICVSVDPGPCATFFARNNGLLAWAKHLISHKVSGDLRTAKKGADSIVFLATTPLTHDASGLLYRDRSPISGASVPNKTRLAKELWRESETLLVASGALTTLPSTDPCEVDESLPG